MTKRQRILIEVLSPPALGAISFVVSDCFATRSLQSISWLPTYLLYAYPIAILPSLVYAALIETWFAYGLHDRFGIIPTILLSVTCGLITGYAVSHLLHWPISLSLCGGVVGLLLGIYIARGYDPVA